MMLTVLMLLICCVCLQRVDCHLPDLTPALPAPQVEGSLTKTWFHRLPGLCGRLRRRRITILCNLEKYCWLGRSMVQSQKIQSGQVCHCPRGSRCSHFFVHSL